MAEAAPLTADEFAAALDRVVTRPATGLVLAVSGGPDSMALMHLMAVVRGRGALPPIVVGTVDHGLRASSAADAARVEQAALALGLPCERLSWTGPKPVRAIQETARAARYQLLTGLCAAVGADHLVTAHTGDDQAETVLFRLLRGSGLGGLGGMRGTAPRDTVQLVRPLLAIGKARLIATCAALGIPVVDDPANADPRFARARLRRLLPRLAAEGFDSASLTRLAGRLARADEALADAATEAFERLRQPAGTALVQLDGCGLAQRPAELTIRVLGRAIAAAGGRPVRLDRLERLAARLREAIAAGVPLRATLGGTLVDLAAGGALRVAREPARRPVPPAAAGARPVAGAPPLSAVADFPWQG